MIKTSIWSASACVAVLALALTGGVANAQAPAPPGAPPKADVKKAEPKKAETKKAEPKKAAAKSPCVGLEQDACSAKAGDCRWVGESKTGAKRKAHCAKIPPKKEAKKAEPKKAAAEPAKAPAPRATAPAPAPKAAAPAPKN